MTKQDFSGFRKPFLETLTELAAKDSKVIFIIGDVGWRFVENYKERFPNQFLNAGAAEQNMMNVAVGKAIEGMKPYVYSMANFVAFRPNEQVRNNIAYGNSNVKLFGVMGSQAYSFLGMSHNIYPVREEAQHYMAEPRVILEDEHYLAHLPNMKFYEPKNESMVREFMLAEYERKGPSYMRI